MKLNIASFRAEVTFLSGGAMSNTIGIGYMWLFKLIKNSFLSMTLTIFDVLKYPPVVGGSFIE